MKQLIHQGASFARNFVLSIFIAVLSLFYGVIAGGQILGLTNLYRPVLVIPFSIVLAVIIFFFYINNGSHFSETFEHPIIHKRNTPINVICVIVGFALFFLLIFTPLIHWPQSPISTELTWDAGLYHFPKAAEMLSTKSANDLSISYGEYPFGYESLIAFSLTLNHTGFLIGTVHALISLFWFLVLSLLLIQRTKLPRGLIVLLLSLLFLSYPLAKDFDSNIWWIFWPQITQIGKNDVILAAATLAVLLHTPMSKDGPFFPFGLAVASMVALSIKPNSILVVAFAWLSMIFFLWRSKQVRKYVNQLLWSILVIIPGVLWVVRNFIMQGVVFSSDSMQLSKLSIANNLANPYFYKYIPQHLYIVVAIILISLLVSFFKRSLRFGVISALILLASFMISPASAFFGSTTEPTQVGWRFALALLSYIFLLLIQLFEPVIASVYHWVVNKKYLSYFVSALILVIGGMIIRTQLDLLRIFPENKNVLHDPYQNAVGIDGYHSAYDYVQKNISNSIVIIENGLPYYLYDPQFTNSVTRSQPADFIVYVRDPNETSGYPIEIDQDKWSQTWLLVYQDSEGRVYKRR